MPSYSVKIRKTLPIELTTVSALNREEAIAQVLKTVVPGEEIQIMDVQQLTPDEAPTGATGTA